MISLADLQAGLATAVLALPAAPLRNSPFAQRGLAVYRAAYRLRLLEVLQADFPLLVRVLGDVEFVALARSYIEMHRSTHFSVRWFGQAFARHVLRQAAPASRRVLAEIAHLEWRLGEAFDAADASVVGPAALAALVPHSWPGARLRFHPAVRLLRVHASTLACWIWARDGGVECDRAALTPSAGEPISMLVTWRTDTLVRYRGLEEVPALALRSALGGADLASICAALAAQHAPADLPGVVARLLSEWLDSGLVSAVDGDG